MPRPNATPPLQECASLGIEGKNVVGELQQLTKSLPQLLFDAVTGIQSKDIEDAVQYYQLHVAEIQGEPGGTPASRESGLLPTLAEARSAPLELPANDEPVLQAGEWYRRMHLTALLHPGRDVCHRKLRQDPTVILFDEASVAVIFCQRRGVSATPENHRNLN